MSPESVVSAKSILENLKCYYCSLYLSVPPIMSNNEQSLICGRCVNKVYNVLFYRAKTIEAIAKSLLFPCRYINNGCKKHDLQWGSVENHEVICENRFYECPVNVLETCKWEGNLKMLLEHFKTDHPNLILNLGHFNLSLQNNTTEIKMIPVWNKVFVMHLVSNASEGKLWFQIYYVGSEEVAEDFYYKLEVQNPDDNKLEFNGTIKASDEWKFNKNNSRELNMDSIKSILNTSIALCRISISGASTSLLVSTNQLEKVDRFMLDDLECPICLEFMVPPIFVCQNGHSVCGDCKQKLFNCSICRVSLGDTRNILLEKLTNRIVYPCKNRSLGCNFTGNSSIITEHHKTCTSETIDCPLKESERCNWKGMVENCSEHVLSKHPNQTWMVVKEHLYRDLNWPTVIDFHIMRFEGNLFKICLMHSLKPEGSISWAFQQVGLDPDKPSPYKFEIEFLDQSNTDRKFIIDYMCCGITSDKDAFNKCLTVSYDLLTPFINCNRYLTFKYDIQKVSRC